MFNIVILHRKWLRVGTSELPQGKELISLRPGYVVFEMPSGLSLVYREHVKYTCMFCAEFLSSGTRKSDVFSGIVVS